MDAASIAEDTDVVECIRRKSLTGTIKWRETPDGAHAAELGGVALRIAMHHTRSLDRGPVALILSLGAGDETVILQPAPHFSAAPIGTMVASAFRINAALFGLPKPAMPELTDEERLRERLRTELDELLKIARDHAALRASEPYRAALRKKIFKTIREIA